MKYLEIITTVSIQWFFAWFWKIKNSKDLEKTNILIDNILVKNYNIFFKSLIDENIYFETLKNLVWTDKKRYLKFIK